MASPQAAASSAGGSADCDASPPDTEGRVAEWIFNYLLDDVVLGFAFDVHRAVSTGLWQVVEGVAEDEEAHRVSQRSFFFSSSCIPNSRTFFFDRIYSHRL